MSTNSQDLIVIKDDEWNKTKALVKKFGPNATTTLRDLGPYKAWQIVRNTVLLGVPPSLAMGGMLIATPISGPLVIIGIVATIFMYTDSAFYYSEKSKKKPDPNSKVRLLFSRDTVGANEMRSKLSPFLTDRAHFWILPEIAKTEQEFSRLRSKIVEAEELVTQPTSGVRPDEIMVPIAQMTSAIIECIDAYDLSVHANALHQQDYITKAERKLVVPKLMDYTRSRIAKIFGKKAYNTEAPRKEFDQCYLVNTLMHDCLTALKGSAADIQQLVTGAKDVITSTIDTVERNNALSQGDKEIVLLCLNEAHSKLESAENFKLRPDQSLVDQFAKMNDVIKTDLALRRNGTTLEDTSVLTRLKTNSLMAIAARHADTTMALTFNG